MARGNCCGLDAEQTYRHSVPEIGLLLAGAVVGFIVNELLGRGLRSALRRRARRDPLIVHVETDPSVI